MNIYGCMICGGEENNYSLMEYCSDYHIYHKTCISKLVENKKYTPQCLNCFIHTISYIDKCDNCLFCDSYLPNCPFKINMCKACEERFISIDSMSNCTYCGKIHTMSIKRCSNCRTCQGELYETRKGIFICEICTGNSYNYNQEKNLTVSNIQYMPSIKQQEELLYEESLKRGESGKCVLCKVYDKDSFILCPKGYYYCKTCRNNGDFTGVRNDCNCSSCKEILSLVDVMNIPKILGQPSKEYKEICSVCNSYKVYNYISQCKNKKLYCPTCLELSNHKITKICFCTYCQNLSKGIFPRFIISCSICSEKSLFNYKSLCYKKFYYCINCLNSRSKEISFKCQCEYCVVISNPFFRPKCSICKTNEQVLNEFVCQNRNFYCEICCGQESFQRILSVCKCDACVELCNFLFTNYMGKKCEICEEKFLAREESACLCQFYYCFKCCVNKAYEISQICNCDWCANIMNKNLSQNHDLYGVIACMICLNTYYWNISDICTRGHFYCYNCLNEYKINVDLVKCTSNYCIRIKEKWSKILNKKEKIILGNISENCLICKKIGIFECKKRHKLCDKCIFEGNLRRLNKICDKINQHRYKEIDEKFWYRCGFKGCKDCVIVPSELMFLKYDAYLSIDNSEILRNIFAYLDGIKVRCFACQLNVVAGKVRIRIQIGCRCKC
ncbi:hypothetical protein SteCoe_35929 [Stentor coeruleus]|uniref:Uncharacterized protein n=1 Tax=Stentor coeruleus TaxID=5963 RepID=A0A1R2AR65_9CILI|nr:hypothetical protein SteCoe_35929 [Stentor coeruleus]